MSPERSSPTYAFLLLALVGSVTALAFSASGYLAGYFREAVAIDVRYGTLAAEGISIAVASAGEADPTRLAADRYLGRANSALVVFEGEPRSVEVSGRAVDLVWLDRGMAVRYLDPGRAIGATVAAPLRSPFLLILPEGYAATVSLRPGERLSII